MKHTGGIVEQWGILASVLVGALLIAWALSKATTKPVAVASDPEEPLIALSYLKSENTRRSNETAALDASLRRVDEQVKKLIERMGQVDEKMKSVESEQDQLQDHMAKVRLSQEFIKGASKPSKIYNYVVPYRRVAAAKPAVEPKRAANGAPIGIVKKIKKQLKELDK